jgi:hypothetical protein
LAHAGLTIVRPVQARFLEPAIHALGVLRLGRSQADAREAAMTHGDGTRRQMLRHLAAVATAAGIFAVRTPEAFGAPPAAGGAAAERSPIPVPEASTLLVPGPADGPHARWAARAAAGLGRGLPTAVALHPAPLGGPDGVTAANRFAASAAPDGRALLLLAGAAAQARLAGEARAKYEPGQWLPLCGIAASAAVVGRPAGPARRGPLRVASPAPEAPETAALLALELLGRSAEPVFGPGGAAALQALAQGEVDAVLLGGPALVPAARAVGAVPWFALGAPGGDGGRDPALADVPVLAELATTRGATPPELASAWRAAAAATRSCVVVLPALTPADMVALWRHAAARWVEEEGQGAAAVAANAEGAAGSRLLSPAEAMQELATLCPRPEATLAYREWLLRRFNWRAV